MPLLSTASFSIREPHWRLGKLCQRITGLPAPSHRPSFSFQLHHLDDKSDKECKTCHPTGPYILATLPVLPKNRRPFSCSYSDLRIAPPMGRFVKPGFVKCRGGAN